MLVLKLVEDLEKYFKITAQRISIAETWDKKPPAEAMGKGLHEFMKEVCRSHITSHTTSDSF